MPKPTMKCNESKQCCLPMADQADKHSRRSSQKNLAPHRMQLSEILRSNAKALHEISLIPLNCTFGVVNEKAPMPFRSALCNETVLSRGNRAAVSVVFVVRRPGCVACREHGLQLSELAAEDTSVAFWGIVKETGVETEGILAFDEDYFHYQLYKDDKWMTYKAMGNRKVTPFMALKRALSARGRWAKKGITNQFKAGDIWIQGGVLLFKDDKLRFAYEEEYGKALVVSDIRAAINMLQREDEDPTSSDASDRSFRFMSSRTEI